MRLEYRADIEIEGENSRKVQVSVIHKKSYNLYGSALLCGITGFLYGGWCWSYVFQPFKDDYNDMRSSSEDLIAKKFKSGFNLIDYEIKRISWIHSPKFFSTSVYEDSESESDPEELQELKIQKPIRVYE